MRERLSCLLRTVASPLFTFAVILICAQDEICCDISVSCWEGLLNPLAEKFRALLGRDKIIFLNECGGAIAGR